MTESFAGGAAAAPLSMRAAASLSSAALRAARQLLTDLERGRRIDAKVLRSAMEAAFGASDAAGAWNWKIAYDVCEAATVLFLRKFGPAMRAKAGSTAAMLPMLARIASLLPTHTRRSEDSQLLQQFSTPIPLGLAACTAAGITPSDRVLEPSAGTGLLAILAELAGGTLMLNELAEARASLLDHLFANVKVTRFDAAQIDGLRFRRSGRLRREPRHAECGRGQGRARRSGGLSAGARWPYANVRQPPISTLNLAHMIPLSAVWAGEVRDHHFKAPPLFFGKTEGSTPFRFSMHVGDVGHTLVVGPTGAGKSVLLALMALQFRRYPDAQIFAFDFGGSIRAAAIAMGGDWHDLGGAVAGESPDFVALQPLAGIDDVSERAWAAEWVASVLGRERIEVTPETKDHVWSALTSLSSAPVEERTQRDAVGCNALRRGVCAKRAG